MAKKIPLTYTYAKLQRRIITPVYLYGVSASVPKDTVTNALWDTGATFSVIMPKVQQELGLIPTGSRLVRGVTGTQKVPVVILTIELPNDLLKQNIEVAVCNFSSDIGMIIGMDIITLGNFVLLHTGDHTEFSFTIPPQNQ
ncbi:MAG: aspartyl protease family protein [Spirochaetaceae bacterium]|jgi:predicted aspartyl protease|nr:aspartyl protease family protein [Spirochaetaceae bacterium]